MSTSYFNLTPTEQGLLLNEASEKSNKSALLLEKDIWVCWALKTLFGPAGAN